MKIYVFALLITCLGLPACVAHAATPPSPIHAIHPPKAMPPIVFEDENGVQHTLSDYRGRIILLNIWATWCIPCTHEMPSLEALQKKFDPQKIMVLPLSEDHNETMVSAFYREKTITTLPVALDHAGNVPSTLELRGLPTTFIIDAKGQEIGRIDGDMNWASPEMIRFFREQAAPKSDPKL